MASRPKNIMLGTAGHVDHGKTSLVKILTGCDTDRLAAEKQRGLTIELGFAPCKMADERIVGIVDVPGHAGFIRNMVSGAHGIDVVILVIAADDGVMPQTREHLDILTLMGVKHGFVALTKIDMVDAEMRELAAEDVREFVEGTFLDGKPICPVSNITGEGFDVLQRTLNESVNTCHSHETQGVFRLWIERSFHVRGFGTIVSGIPVSGSVSVGDELQLAGGNKTGRVRGLEVYGRQAEHGLAGQCVAINITDIPPESLSAGQLLCEPGLIEPVAMAEAELFVLPSASKPMKDYFEAHLHVGTVSEMCKVAMLEGRPIEAGGRELVQLRLAKPVALVPGERFVVRGPGGSGQLTTVGGGRILDTSNIRLRRNRPWTIQRLRRRLDAIDDPTAWCSAVLRESQKPATASELSQSCMIQPSRVAEILAQLAKKEFTKELPSGKWIHADVLQHTADAVCDVLRQFHEANPTRAGMTEADIESSIGFERALVSAAVGVLQANGKVEVRGDLLAIPGSGQYLSPEAKELCDRLEHILRDAKLQPPIPADLAAMLGIDEQTFDDIVTLLADGQTVCKLDAKVIMHADAIAIARQAVLDMFRKSGSFQTMEFRDALGVSRKYAVPLLDYFDSMKLTTRSANRRRPGAEARKLLD